VKVDFELVQGKPKMLVRSTTEDWLNNLSTILRWSPYPTEADLMKQVPTQAFSVLFLCMRLEEISSKKLSHSFYLLVRGLSRCRRRCQVEFGYIKMHEL
jgi:hypothetical protein